jgi:hypothetical protein
MAPAIEAKKQAPAAEAADANRDNMEWSESERKKQLFPILSMLPERTRTVVSRPPSSLATCT